MAGNLIGTKRISLPVEVAGLDALRMVSNRNMKISASIVVLPGESRKLGLVEDQLASVPFRRNQKRAAAPTARLV